MAFFYAFMNEFNKKILFNSKPFYAATQKGAKIATGAY
jgi:hypothetical protein